MLFELIGASAAGLDSLLITDDGVHRVELGSAYMIETAPNNDIRYTNLAGEETTKTQQKSLISKVCDLCDREGTARPSFILRHCTY